jgi:hypothetical protein
MRDPLDELENFTDPGLTMDQLPASEVRRRGTRMRRRNNALAAIGGVAAVAIIATPLAMAASGNRTDTTPPPTNPSPSVRWVQEIPAGFPLAADFPTPAATTTRPDASQIPTCGKGLGGPYEDQLAVQYTGESEDYAQRRLVVYADEATAAAELAALRGATTDCKPVPGGPGSGVEQFWSPVPTAVRLAVDDAYVYAQQVRHDDGLVSDLTLVEVFRVGNALLFDSAYGAAGGDQVIRDEVVRRTDAAEQVVDAMCVFSADPC